MTNKEIIKFINDNCRYCDTQYDDKFDLVYDCEDCPLLQKALTDADMRERGGTENEIQSN